MQVSMKSGFIALLLFGAAVAGGCASASDGEATEARSDAVARSCTVSGSPPVTSGCDAGQYCKVVACTNSIPPSCWGACAAKPKLQKCTGAFNCLCGTPVCINGEWACDGNCGPDGPIE